MVVSTICRSFGLENSWVQKIVSWIQHFVWPSYWAEIFWELLFFIKSVGSQLILLADDWIVHGPDNVVKGAVILHDIRWWFVRHFDRSFFRLLNDVDIWVGWSVISYPKSRNCTVYISFLLFRVTAGSYVFVQNVAGSSLFIISPIAGSDSIWRRPSMEAKKVLLFRHNLYQSTTQLLRYEWSSFVAWHGCRSPIPGCSAD